MNDSPALRLRPARAPDAAAIATLSRVLIEAGLGWRYTPRRVAALIDDPDTLTVVADDAGRIAGFATMQFGDDDGHLTLLAVRPERQRRGTASALLGWLLQSARVAGLRSIALELRSDNAAALAFYRRCGFSETVLVPDYYADGVAARRMTLALRSHAG